MKNKVIAVALTIVVCVALLSLEMFASSSTKPIEDCPVEAQLFSSLRVRSSATATSSCSGHMTSVFVYAYNSITGESGISDSGWVPTEAMGYVSETVTLSVPPTYAHSYHGAWCVNDDDDDHVVDDGYVVEELTDYGTKSTD